MNTKLIMTASAILMGITGIILSFLPHEVLAYLSGSSATAVDALVLQILGALYFAFAMTNWTARANLIGGIYGRPIAVGNLTHFVIGALALVKGFSLGEHLIVQVATGVYVVFAIVFGIIIYTHPVK